MTTRTMTPDEAVADIRELRKGITLDGDTHGATSRSGRLGLGVVGQPILAAAGFQPALPRLKVHWPDTAA